MPAPSSHRNDASVSLNSPLISSNNGAAWLEAQKDKAQSFTAKRPKLQQFKEGRDILYRPNTTTATPPRTGTPTAEGYSWHLLKCFCVEVTGLRNLLMRKAFDRDTSIIFICAQLCVEFFMAIFFYIFPFLLVDISCIDALLQFSYQVYPSILRVNT